VQAQREIAIVGGGLVGSLLATFLVRRGLGVTVWEQRADPRAGSAAGGRSINLVVTSRGIRALRRVRLDGAVARITVPVTGRMMHSLAGERTYQPYGRDASESNHSISRGELNRVLIDEAERRGVRFEFSRRLVEADLDRPRLTFADETGGASVAVEPAVAIGADGAGSALRAALCARGAAVESVAPLGHGYKELLIPAGPDGSPIIERNALHIWPRGDLMLMALPNLDGSFTVTLYLPEQGAASFAALDSAAAVRALFERQFPDAVPLIPDLERSFLAKPTGFLGTVRCDPWHFGGHTLLIGDAAHAVVPFFGQGMNAGFEDCTVLDELLDAHRDDWGAVLPAFTRARKPHADAIADMALENFVEMRDRVGDRQFLLRKQVEHRLERDWPLEYRSRYSLVMYGDVPYAVAREAGRIQDAILDELCRGLEDADRLDMSEARRLVRERLAPFLAAHGVDLDY
jgi:kynurenine 3-monooxygenase